MFYIYIIFDFAMAVIMLLFGIWFYRSKGQASKFLSSYRTAYLKAYYPTEFMAAMLNSFLGNLDKIPLLCLAQYRIRTR